MNLLACLQSERYSGTGEINLLREKMSQSNRRLHTGKVNNHGREVYKVFILTRKLQVHEDFATPQQSKLQAVISAGNVRLPKRYMSWNHGAGRGSVRGKS